MILTSAYEVTEWAVANLPSMRIEDETLFIKGEQKKIIFHHEPDFLFIIDADQTEPDQHMMESIDQAEFVIFLLKNKFVLKTTFNQKQIQYPSNFHQLITPHTLIQWRDWFLWISPVILLFYNLYYLIFSKALEVLIIAGLGFGFIKFKGLSMNFLSLISLSVFALGPALLFIFIMAAFGLHLSYFIFLYLIIHFYYLYRGLYILEQRTENGG